jgi:hypothetical protein
MARRRRGVQSDIIGQAEFSRRSIVYVHMAGAAAATPIAPSSPCRNILAACPTVRAGIQSP